MDANGRAPPLGNAAVPTYLLALFCGATRDELGAFARAGFSAPVAGALAVSPAALVRAFPDTRTPADQQLVATANGEDWYQDFVLNRFVPTDDVARVAATVQSTRMGGDLGALAAALLRHSSALLAVRDEVAGLRRHEATPPAAAQAAAGVWGDLPEWLRSNPEYVLFLATYLGGVLAHYFPRLRDHAEALAVVVALAGRAATTAGQPKRRVTAVAIA